MSRTSTRRAAFTAQVRHRIRIVMAVNNINGKSLAKDTQLAYPTLMMVMNSRQVQPKLSYLARISEALNFDLDALVGPQCRFAYNVSKAVKEMA